MTDRAQWSPGAQAVYRELDGRKGILDGIDDRRIVEEICEATAAAVLAASKAEAAEDQWVRRSLGGGGGEAALAAFGGSISADVIKGIRALHDEIGFGCPARGEGQTCCIDHLVGMAG